MPKPRLTFKKPVSDVFTTYTGHVFRCHDPRWSFLPDSGEGARLKGGRFNKVGTAALYTSLTLEGAYAEAQQGFTYKPQPLTICTYEVECSELVDLTCDHTCQILGLDPRLLAAGWALDPYPVTHKIADALIRDGVAGIIVPSFTTTAPAGAKNIVFWDWSATPPHQVVVIDDNDRLPKNQDSWT